ncbi:MAG: helix-turn-helix domain-containing protein [Lentimicrobiaceae bacterium]|nr:helix-turn-helix domain-containing protein [Lentimicrobiaceae bacterium]
MKKVLENIRILRESKGYSQEFMAELLKMTQSAYARFERGATKTDLKTVSLVAKVLEMHLIDIITYPERYVNIKDISKEIVTSEPEVILQIKVTGQKRDQILKTAFENSGFEMETLLK